MMQPRICEHLQEYGALYARTEAAYQACTRQLDQVLADGPERGRLDGLAAALEAWLALDRQLRRALVDLVAAGEVRIPRRAPRVRKRRNGPVCSVCRQRIPRLQTPEWSVTGNGLLTYRGRELPFAEPIGTRSGGGSGTEKVGV